MSPADTHDFQPANQEEPSRIAFLCGCLEPGADGVGDYTALLAGECERRGCATLRIALNDRYVNRAEAGEGVLRLGAGMDWAVRIEQAREGVERFGADAVSLQWVPYGFHDRGVPWGIERGLAGIVGGRRLQVMCHEVWIGAEIGARLGHRVIGAAQREVMRRVFQALSPGCVQTSNAVYAALLRALSVHLTAPMRSSVVGPGRWPGRAYARFNGKNVKRVEAEVLPLFGAIPVTGAKAEREEGLVRFGMFGTLHPLWPAEPLLGRLRDLGKRIEIEHIGRIGEGERIWREMAGRYEFCFKRHGEQPPARVSQFLMEMDFGIATTPLALIGKSATAAAMLEHGLPVIVNRDDVRYAGLNGAGRPEGVIVMDEGLIETLRGARRGVVGSRLERVADQFLDGLRKMR